MWGFVGFIAFFTEIWLYIKGKKFRVGINFADIWSADYGGHEAYKYGGHAVPSQSKSNNNMEGTPPLRGVPYPTF